MLNRGMRDDTWNGGLDAPHAGRSGGVSGSGVLHLLYHRLSGSPDANRYVMPKAQFAQHLQLFQDVQQSPTTVVPAITFDDGHTSDVELALPLLDAHRIRATFFITAGWTGTRSGYMDRGHLRTLYAAGQTIGAHGWSHALLPSCSATELQRELVDARGALEDAIGAPVTAMSFPGGRFNRRVIDACREAGYTRLYTSNPALQMPGSDAEQIGRLNLRADTETAWLARLLAGDGVLLGSLQRTDRLKRMAKACLGDVLYAALWRVVNHAEHDA